MPPLPLPLLLSSTRGLGFLLYKWNEKRGEGGERVGRGWGEGGERVGRGWGEGGERVGRGLYHSSRIPHVH